MRKYLPYILAVLLGGAIIALVLTGSNKRKKHIDERITLRKKDKIPYGTYVAFNALDKIFPKAEIITASEAPGDWPSIDYNPGQALIIITGQFNADAAEMRKLIGFAEQGNDVFISAMSISESAANILGCQTNNYSASSYYGDNPPDAPDSLVLTLDSTTFGIPDRYTYPGKSYSSAFTNIDEKTTRALGRAEGMITFVHLKAGSGNFYVHLAPLAFTNYFLLHKKNISYYEKALSLINPNVKKVIWDEYYLNKKFIADERRAETSSGKKDWFSVLMNIDNGNGQKPFRWAFWLLILLLLIYVLQEMRRKQRHIPPMPKPRNDSMDFVKTIGRLYHDKGDHKNLAKKMAAYFLEHVRNKYKLLTGNLDEVFVKNLQYKSGAEEQLITQIVGFINFIDKTPAISDRQLIVFHQQLESFYKIA